MSKKRKKQSNGNFQKSESVPMSKKRKKQSNGNFQKSESVPMSKKSKKINCWEYYICPDEYRLKCPAYTEKKLDSVNGGCNGGRACWGLENTLGYGLQHKYNDKVRDCLNCNFLKKVIEEEKKDFINTYIIMKMLGKL
jgi:hypothetical protein